MVRIAAFIVVGMLCASFLPLAADTGEVDLRYGFIFIDPSGHVVEIELFVYNMDAAPLVLTMRHCPGESAEEPIQRLKIFTRMGRALAYEFWREGDDCFWKVEPSETSEILFNYYVTLMSTDPIGEEHDYVSYLGVEYGASRADRVFIFPYNRSVSSVTTRFYMNPKWQAATPWEKRGDDFISSSLEYFLTSTFALGNFSTRTESIGETGLTLAIWNGFDEQTRGIIAESSSRAFDYLKGVWGAVGPPSHLAIFLPPTGDGKEVAALASTQSQALVFKDASSSMNTFASQVVRIWNGWSPYGMQPAGSEEEWFCEGVSAYYGDKTLYELGIDRSHAAVRKMDEEYRKIILGTRYDIPVTKARQTLGKTIMEKRMADVLIREKGALVAFILDYEIQRRTGGQMSLDDLVSRMYAEFGPGKEAVTADWDAPPDSPRYSNADILRILNAMTGDDYTPLFDEYVYGKKELDVGEYLRDGDGDGLTDMDETHEGTDAGNPDSDGDGAVDGRDLNPLIFEAQPSTAPPPQKEEADLSTVPFLFFLLIVYLILQVDQIR